MFNESEYQKYIESVIANLLLASGSERPNILGLVGQASLAYKKAQVMKSLPIVPKTGKFISSNKSYPYTTEADLYGVAQKALGGYGLAITVSQPDVEIIEIVDSRGNKTPVVVGAISITLTDSHTGYSEVVTRKVWVHASLGDKAPNALIGHALKYWLKGTFAIETGEGDDPDSSPPVSAPPVSTPSTLTAETLAQLKAELERTGTDQSTILSYYKVDPLAALTVQQAAVVLQRLSGKPTKETE